MQSEVIDPRSLQTMGRVVPAKGQKMAKKSAPPPPRKMKKNNQQKHQSGRKNNSNKKSGSKRISVLRLPDALKKELELLNQNGDQGSDDDQKDGEKLHGDEYEYEEELPKEETQNNRRYDQVDKLEYELPSDFEDEEIDEDTAFGVSSDNSEERHIAKGRVNACCQGKQTSQIDLNSDEEDRTSGSEDLSGSEGDNDEEVADRDQLSAGRQQLENQEEEEEGEEEEEEEEEGDEEDSERHQKMLQAVTGMSSEAVEGKKRRKKIVVSEAYPESEFNLNKKPSGTTENVSIQDLMAPLYGSSGFGSLRKRMQQLEKNAMPVEAPLPKVVKEKLERKAAYVHTKEDVTKWQPIVKKNREASTIKLDRKVDAGKTGTGVIAYDFTPTTALEKEITSLLQSTSVVEAQKSDGVELLELNKLTVEQVRERQGRLAKMRNLMFRHELKAKHIKKIKSKTYHRLLKKERIKAGLGETPNDPEAAKEYAMKQEFKRAEERMTLKHKNTSKWAKRVLKRGLEKQDEGTRAAIAEQLHLNTLLSRKIHSVNESSSSDESSSEDDDNAEITLHSDDKPKSQIIAKAKEETLKIVQDEEEEIPKSGLLSLPFMVRSLEKRKKQAHDEAVATLEEYESALRSENEAGAGDEANDAPKGRLVFGELDRQTSKLRCHKESNTDLDDMLVDKSDGSGSDSENDMKQDLAQKCGGTNLQEQVKAGTRIASKEYNIDLGGLHKEGSLARQEIKTAGPVFVNGSHKISHQDNSQKSLPVVSGECNLKVESAEKSVASTLKKTIPSEVPNSNPWLFGESGGKVSEELPSGINVVPGERHKKKKRKGRRNEKNEHDSASKMQETNMRANPTVSIAGISKADADRIINQNNREVSEPGTSNGKTSGHLQEGDRIESGCSSEDESENGSPSKGMTLLGGIGSQADLIQRAFAGDDVEGEFNRAKAEVLDKEVPASEGVVSLPGWGQWTHVQQRKGLPSWILEKEEEEKKKRDEARKKRKDAKLKFVIISEKVDKKSTKFNTPSLPFPYESKDAFERSMRMPLGPDFNTVRAHQNMIRPAVIKKAGVVIDPIKYEKQQPKDKKLHSISSTGKRKWSSNGQGHPPQNVQKRSFKGRADVPRNGKSKGFSNKASR